VLSILKDAEVPVKVLRDEFSKEALVRSAQACITAQERLIGTDLLPIFAARGRDHPVYRHVRIGSDYIFCIHTWSKQIVSFQQSRHRSRDVSCFV